MNLYTPGKGLFGTHVAWNDIEEDICRKLHNYAFFGPNKTAENIGDGKGFMSRIVLVDPNWQFKDKDLPNRFIVKILTQLAMRTLNHELDKDEHENSYNTKEFMNSFDEGQKILHNADVTLYSHLKAIPAGKFLAPKIYYMKKFSESNPVKGYIIMEYIKNFKIVNIYENISLTSMKEILRALAVLEATFLKLKTNERNDFTQNLFTKVYGRLFNGKAIELAIQSLRNFCGDYLAEKIDKLNKIVKEVVDVAFADKLPEELGMQRVVCHGDLWSSNILWRQDCEDNLKLAALLDFQCVHIGCPASDLARVFCSCLSGKDRQEHWEELLEEFYIYLEEEIDDGRMPYGLEQLKESYRRFFPFAGFLIVTVIGPFFSALCKNPDDAQRKKSMDAATEKLEYLLNDILYFHHRNCNRRNTVEGTIYKSS